MNWQRLDLLSNQFAANLQALSRQNAPLARAVGEHHPVMLHVICAEGDRLHVGQLAGQQVNVLPCHLDLRGAQQVAKQLFPGGVCSETAQVTGLDQGWLWDALIKMPTSSPAKPGHRPPLIFLCRSIEQLWVALHIHDWHEALASGRILIFVGADAVDQLRRYLIAHPRVSPPRLSVTVDPALWTGGLNLDALNARVITELNHRLAMAIEQLKSPGGNESSLTARLNGPGPLRILGITSRYTTFLQHSMRDWLAAFEAMGHQTRLLIEEADHEQLNSLVLAEACELFRPDLILLIDHFRAELSGLPDNVPCVMWIQDYLPNMFSPGAGAAQGPCDFVIGYNRTECSTRFGYPYERFMPSLVAVNEARFAPPGIGADDRRQFECDVCFVSHASLDAQTIIQQQIRQNPHAKDLLKDAFERLRAIYQAGHFLSHPLHVRALIQESMRDTRLMLDAPSLQAMTDLFTHRVNNAMLRHQALDWAAEMGLNLHIWGNGWEQHPRFGKYARGPADNQTVLARIFRCARISLQATPHGAVHQRLLEGLASGGFFLIRYVPGDLLGRIYQPLWDWIVREGIESDEQILARATPEVLQLLGQFQRTIGIDPFQLQMKLIDDVRTNADLNFFSSAGSLWPQYDQVVFDSKSRLQSLIAHYLTNETQRREIAQAMRQRVLETMTYTRVNQRMLKFIGEGMNRRAVPSTAAA